MLKENHRQWLTGKGLDPNLAERLGIRTTEDEEGVWLSVPFFERGREIGRHDYRAGRLRSRGPLCLWNHDALLDPKLDRQNEQVLIIAGSPWAAQALILAGFTAVVAVPEVGPDAEEDAFDYIWRSQSLLEPVKTFIIATDDDQPGRVLAAELVRRLDPARCRFLPYPADCHGVLDVLQTWGPAALVETIEASKPYPIKNIFRLSDFPTPPEMPTYSYGIPELANMLPVVPQTLTVVTGYAGAGKSTMLAVMKAFLMKHQGLGVAAGLFETMPKPILQRKLRAAMIRCGEHSIPVTSIGEADRVIEQKLSLISQLVDEDDEMSLEDFLELARIAVVRDGARVIILDPWNELEHKRKKEETDHDYQGRAIRMIKTFMRRYDVAFWVVGHPRKPDLTGTKIRMPSLYDISGTAHWANKADYGLVIFRPDKTSNVVEAHVTKVKMGLPGKEGVVRLAYDFRHTEYTLVDDAAEPEAE